MNISPFHPKKFIPQNLWFLLRNIRNYSRKIIYVGNKRFCPVCKKSSRRFVRLRSRREAICAYCLSLERHRFVWYYLKEKSNLLIKPNLKMLHIAPEPALEKLFKLCIGAGYLTADLFNPNVMVKMDITDIQYPEESFDVIFCSHVLEHVHDDKKAIGELFRVLRKNGRAILMVPINSEITIEDPSITDSAERLRLFGQEDHVRSYGPDFKGRLEEAGFKVKIISPPDVLTNEEMIRIGVINCAGDIFYCTRI